MPDDTVAKAAIDALNNSEWETLIIAVKQAELRVVHKGSYKVGNGTKMINRFKRAECHFAFIRPANPLNLYLTEATE